MIEIIFYGRGGQGVVTAAQVLATAAFQEGKYAHAFPSFGPERRGAPVTAYTRINEKRIADRSQIINADYVIVLDPNVLNTSRPLNSLKETGCAILNIAGSGEDIRNEVANDRVKLFYINASRISEEFYGKKPIPITNIAMLGAFASISSIVQLENILSAVDHFFSDEQAENAKKTAHVAYRKMEGAKIL